MRDIFVTNVEYIYKRVDSSKNLIFYFYFFVCFEQYEFVNFVLLGCLLRARVNCYIT